MMQDPNLYLAFSISRVREMNWLRIALFAIILLLPSRLEGADSYEPKGREYWRKQFAELIQGMQWKEKPPPFPNTRRLMAAAQGAVLFCHMEELTAALEIERLWIIQRGVSESEQKILINGPMECRDESLELMRDGFKKAATELRAKTSALEKLKAYYSTLLTLLKRIPAAPTNLQSASRALMILQGKDKELLNQKSNDLTVELELAVP